MPRKYGQCECGRPKAPLAQKCRQCARAPLSLERRKHLLAAGAKTRFTKGHQRSWNAKPEWSGLPRNKYRQPMNPCPDCGRLKMVEHTRCRRCANVALRKTHERIGVGGYVYGSERITRGDGRTRGKPIHVQKAEQVLGRPMKRGEVVHHINCDRADNRNSNLLICSAHYHTWLHGQYSKRFAQLHLTS